MKRRDFVKTVGITTGAVIAGARSAGGQGAKESMLVETVSDCRVVVDNEVPRLYLNGRPVAPILACATSMIPTAAGFREAGIRLLHPIISLDWGWLGPDEYEWGRFEGYFQRLVEQHPEALFFPRVQLATPRWWKEVHPDQMIQYGLDAPDSQFDYLGKTGRTRSEGGYIYGSSRELWEASFASEAWRKDTGTALRLFIRFMQKSSIADRMVGYFIAHGRTAEWNCFGTDYLPDTSGPMRERCGKIPSTRERLGTSYGLLRDPLQEAEVIDFYRRYHDTIADAAVHFCGIVKQEVGDSRLCGTFFAYLTESVRIQEGGYLAPWKVLDSPDIDVIACPYAYQNTNVAGRPRWENDMEDGAGNWLGRARGVAGDGAFRAMVESIRRRGKLYISEADPSTYLDVENRWRSIGGSGSDTVDGTLNVMRRDLGKALATGVGVWLLDFGPMYGVESGWYGDDPIIDEIRRFSDLLARASVRDLKTVSEIAVLCDTDSFFATRHWLNDSPWQGYGIRGCDVFNHWFLNAQSRSIHRLGAPIDWLYWRDLKASDLDRYKLLLVPNLFFVERDDAIRLRALLDGSGVTVVWYYAPGFLSSDGPSEEAMAALTGIRLRALEAPGPLMIRCEEPIDGIKAYGVKGRSHYRPRFAVDPYEEVEVLGNWATRDRAIAVRPDGIALARKQVAGWTSVFTGSAPLPVEILRRFARDAGVRLWSSEPDIVHAAGDVAMIVATSEGDRTVTLHRPMTREGSDEALRFDHRLSVQMGEVTIFKNWD